jgi:hypothetical protein
VLADFRTFFRIRVHQGVSAIAVRGRRGGPSFVRLKFDADIGSGLVVQSDLPGDFAKVRLIGWASTATPREN